jgi:hypothetical protein
MGTTSEEVMLTSFATDKTHVVVAKLNSDQLLKIINFMLLN